MESGDNTVGQDNADEQDQDQDDSPVLWLRVREHNNWEGETWYHYFLSEEGVKEALQAAVRHYVEGLSLREVLLTWSAAEALANEEPGYMDTHWFGRLKDFGVAQAGQDDLYKGGIRKFGEELMGYVDSEPTLESIEEDE